MFYEVNWWWFKFFVDIAHPRPAFRRDELVLFKICIKPPRWSIVGGNLQGYIKRCLGIYPVTINVCSDCFIEAIKKI